MFQDEKRYPLFSIGITTYNRKELLRGMILSLINQQFKDFEIIIGNDYLQEPLTSEMLNINDERIVIYNNEKNLGELENMNSLLRLARGKYFSWQFDDDLCASDFLSETYKAILKFNYPECVFSAFYYIYGNSTTTKVTNKRSTGMREYSGRNFLRSYLSGAIRVLGTGGFFKTEYLRNSGGAIRLSNGKMAVYSEYLMIFKAGLLDNLVYIKTRLLGNRVHEGSFSCNSAEVELYKQAGLQLIRESIKIFSDNKIVDDYEQNLSSLLKSVISVIITKSRIAGQKFRRNEIVLYLSLIENEFHVFEGRELYVSSIRCSNRMKILISFFRIKAHFKSKMPIKYLKYFHSMISLVSKYTNKSF